MGPIAKMKVSNSKNDKQSPEYDSFFSWKIMLFSFFTLWFFCAAFFFPITQDETYYFSWSQFLNAGYFDHPPAVAWLSYLSRLVGGSFLNARTATVFLSLGSMFFLLKLYTICEFRSQKRLLVAMLLGLGNLGALVCGFLTTPDAVVFFAWTLALHEAVIALTQDEKRWITAGFSVGIGLLGKLSMLLIGPVFLFALLRSKKGSLKSPWPYLGGVAAFLVFLPNLYWNMNNDWITWKFQLKHGLGMERANLLLGKLPIPERADAGSNEAVLSELFHAPEILQEDTVEGEANIEAGEEMQFQSFLTTMKGLLDGGSVPKRLGDFLSAQISLWGLLFFPLLAQLLAIIFRKRNLKNAESFDSDIFRLLLAGTLVPLCVFFLFAFKSKVEANWPAMYMIAAAPLLANYLRPSLKWVGFGVCCNLFVLLAVIGYTYFPFLQINPGFDRILRETHGYKNLALDPMWKKDRPVFADSFQLVSMLNYYNRSLSVSQWPGITRVSEFVRDQRKVNYNLKHLRSIGSFQLVTTEKVPPRIPNFQAVQMKLVTDCREGQLEIYHSVREDSKKICHPIHRWYLIDYALL